MGALDNQKILFCVSSGLAAYQLPELVVALNLQGAQVTVLVEPGGGEWVSLRLLAMHADQVATDASELSGDLNEFSARVLLVGEHPLADNSWLDQVIADATDRDYPVTLLLAGGEADEPVSRLRQSDWISIPAQASSGLPRFDAEAVIAALARAQSQPLLAGKRLLVTAGPTFEDIDPVRFIGNRSSGKMGFAVATAAWHAGAQVELITGPVARPSPQGVKLTRVRSARDMLTAVEAVIDQQDIYISSAAIADYRPLEAKKQKIKKGQREVNLELVANPDLLKWVTQRPEPPFCVGFAAETERVEEYARGKMASKNLQMIAANQVGAEAGGFESEHNQLHLFWSGGSKLLAWSSKAEQARQLIETVAERYAGWR